MGGRSLAMLPALAHRPVDRRRPVGGALGRFHPVRAGAVAVRQIGGASCQCWRERSRAGQANGRVGLARRPESDQRLRRRCGLAMCGGRIVEICRCLAADRLGAEPGIAGRSAKTPRRMPVQASQAPPMPAMKSRPAGRFVIKIVRGDFERSVLSRFSVTKNLVFPSLHRRLTDV